LSLTAIFVVKLSVTTLYRHLYCAHRRASSTHARVYIAIFFLRFSLLIALMSFVSELQSQQFTDRRLNECCTVRGSLT